MDRVQHSPSPTGPSPVSAPLAPLRHRARLTEAPLQARAGRSSRGDRGPAFAAAGCRLRLAKDGDPLNMQGRARARAALCTCASPMVGGPSDGESVVTTLLTE